MCFGVMYSGEYNVFDVTLSVYPDVTLSVYLVLFPPVVIPDH